MQWQQGYNQPYGAGQQQAPPSFLGAQPTGMYGQPQMNMLQNQRTGYPMQPQPTGFMPQQTQMTGFPQQQQAQMGMPPSMPSMPSQFQQQQPQRSFLSPMTTGMPSSQLQPQQTSMQPQIYGGPAAHVPSIFTQSFLPANPAQPIYGNHLQFNQPSALAGQSLQQAYAQQNVQQHGQATVKVPWALSADERKSYDSIFRAWDQKGTGFIEGSMSQEVFGQSVLG